MVGTVMQISLACISRAGSRVHPHWKKAICHLGIYAWVHDCSVWDTKIEGILPMMTAVNTTCMLLFIGWYFFRAYWSKMQIWSNDTVWKILDSSQAKLVLFVIHEIVWNSEMSVQNIGSVARILSFAF